MAVKANRLKSELAENTVKETGKEKDEKKAPKEKKPSRLSPGSLDSVTSFFGDKKTHFIAGVALVLFSFYFLFAFTSFLFTWRADFSEVAGSWVDYLKSDTKAANWLGKLGAILAHQFIYGWFGLSSYAFVLLFMITGFRVAFNISLLPLGKTYRYSLFSLIFVSTTLGYLSDIRWLGGTFGYFSSLWLSSILGQIGTGLLLLFTLGIFVVLAFNLPFQRKEKEIEPEEKEPADTVTVNERKADKNDIRPSVIAPAQGRPEEFPKPEMKVVNTAPSTIITPPQPSVPGIQISRQETVSNTNAVQKGPSFEVESPEEEPEPEMTLSRLETPAPVVHSLEDIEAKEEEELEEPLDEEEIEDEEELDEEDDLDEEDEDEEDFDEDEDEEELEEEETEEEELNEMGIAAESRESVKAKESAVPLAIEAAPAENAINEEFTQEVPDGEYDPKLDLSSYKFPSLDLLENYGTNKIQVGREELEENKNRIVETLGHYNIDIDKIKATIGPTVTLYEIVPKAGVRISKIKNLEDDIALSLSALGIRIIAPIPGKGTIGIEVPNQKPEIVSMKSILASEKFQNTDMDLPIGLGKTISNEVFIADLAKMPHLLMAGATGQGKSVGLNAILVSLLYKKHPSQVKFVLVDPKKVELTLFKTIERHFLAKLPGEEEAIITDTKKVINTLNSLCIEMDQRYDLLKDAQTRNIKEYNTKFIARRLNPNKGHHFLPYIVLVVDEFADLIMTAGKEVEMPIARLAQLARAIGIHLIIATQRPSVNIITGTIKANFPARIAFRVTSKIDSRTILDAGGADQLIGRGDLLFSTGADLIRIQCAFVDTPEVEKITDYIGGQRGYASAFILPEYVDESGGGNAGDFNSADRDAYFEEAARIIVQHQQGSASLLQRRLKLGYNRAGRIIDQLESAGIIGPFEGSKAREVLIPDEHSLEQFLAKYK